MPIQVPKQQARKNPFRPIYTPYSPRTRLPVPSTSRPNQPLRLPTNSHTNILPVTAIVRRTIRRLREHARTARARRRTVLMKTLSIAGREREPASARLAPKIIGVGIDLADIVADARMQVRATVRVLELQRAGREVVALAPHLERDAVVGVGRVGFRVGAAVGGEGLDRVAAGRLPRVGLVAALEDDGEGAGVADVGLADAGGGRGVDGCVATSLGGPLVVEEGLVVGCGWEGRCWDGQGAHGQEGGEWSREMHGGRRWRFLDE